MNNDYERGRIESELEVRTYLDRLRYALSNGMQILWQRYRFVDQLKAARYTNEYAMQILFPNEKPENVLRRELMKLSVEDYIKTVMDNRFPERSEMREFGKVYNETDEVYIKIRVELLGEYGSGTMYVMSFHFSEIPFQKSSFPYRKA